MRFYIAAIRCGSTEGGSYVVLYIGDHMLFCSRVLKVTSIEYVIKGLFLRKMEQNVHFSIEP